jgi:hypothetical protein
MPPTGGVPPTPAVPPIPVVPPVPMLHVPAGAQAAPHGTVPPGQAQTLFVQTLPPGHALPQAPQFNWSMRVSTHAPLGQTMPGHVAEHAAFEQYGAFAGQAMLQLPQFLASESGFMQLVPHCRSPGAHTHCPFEHARPTWQRLPHCPQLFGSILGSVHPPPHT